MATFVFGEQIIVKTNIDPRSLTLFLTTVALISIYFLIKATVEAATSRHWRLAISAVAAPVVAIVAPLLCAKAGFTAAWVVFTLLRPWYECQVYMSPRGPEGLRFRTFDWGEMSGLLVTVRYTIVYDESGRMRLSVGRHDELWAIGASRDPALSAVFKPAGHTAISPLSGHFYYVEQIF